MGGNKFEIVYLKKKSLKELHAFWDSTAHVYGEVKVPLSESNYDKLQGIAKEVTELYPRSELVEEMKRTTFESWIEEGGEKAHHNAYYDLKMKSGDTLTDEYVEQAQDLVKKQFALGGYRLADWFINLYGKSNDDSVEVSQ